MTEARDKMSAKRAAFREAAAALAHRITESDMEGLKRPMSAMVLTPEVRAELIRIQHSLVDAAAIEDAPNLNDCIDGTPLPGKCQDPMCAGPHASFEDEAPVKTARQTNDVGPQSTNALKYDP